MTVNFKFFYFVFIKRKWFLIAVVGDACPVANAGQIIQSAPATAPVIRPIGYAKDSIIQ